MSEKSSMFILHWFAILFIFLMCTRVLSMWMSVWRCWISWNWVNRGFAMWVLGLERVLWKSNWCSKLLSHFSSPKSPSLMNSLYWKCGFFFRICALLKYFFKLQRTGVKNCLPIIFRLRHSVLDRKRRLLRFGKATNLIQKTRGHQGGLRLVIHH